MEVVEGIAAVEGLAVGTAVVGEPAAGIEVAEEVENENAPLALQYNRTAAAGIDPAAVRQCPAGLPDNTRLRRLHVEVDCMPWLLSFPNALRRESVFSISAAINTSTRSQQEKRKEEGDSAEKRGEVYPTKALPS